MESDMTSEQHRIPETTTSNDSIVGDSAAACTSSSTRTDETKNNNNNMIPKPKKGLLWSEIFITPISGGETFSPTKSMTDKESLHGKGKTVLSYIERSGATVLLHSP